MQLDLAMSRMPLLNERNNAAIECSPEIKRKEGEPDTIDQLKSINWKSILQTSQYLGRSKSGLDFSRPWLSGQNCKKQG